MRTLYFDCFAGASGNMILGALIDAGVSGDALAEELGNLDLPAFSIECEKSDRAGIGAVHVKTVYNDEEKHRHFSEIAGIIDSSRLRESVKARSISVFKRLASAEAKVHGTDIEKVHFHEVGAMDAIIDIVGACVGFEMLGIGHFLCSRINLGSGSIDIKHGKYPVPPPAVAELLKGMEVFSDGTEGELITPTGAAIITEVCGESVGFPAIKIESTGYGAGSRNYEKFPNVLRIVIGESLDTKGSDTADANLTEEELTLIETNVDDVSPQVLGFVMERVFDAGALDCWFTPIHMKKNRPATMLSVLCVPEAGSAIIEILFRETTTLGVRTSNVGRKCLKRRIEAVSTRFGDIDVKIAFYGDRIVNIKPEFDQVRRRALENEVPLREIEEAVQKAIDAKKRYKAAG